MLNTAIKAARSASSIINRAALDLGALTVREKREKDYVSEVDQAAEAVIVDMLRHAYPAHAVLGEEAGWQGPANAEYVWIIDPLDGTTNFLHGVPQYAVSIGLKHRGQITQAVVYDTSRNELFTATRGAGAFMNNRRLRVSSRIRLGECLIGTGFPFREFSHAETYIKLFREFMMNTSGLRRPGSAALDLAWVAAGRFDGFFEIGLNAWDLAAGSLLVQEAGGLVGDFAGEQRFLETGHILAATPKIFPQMLALMRPHLPEEFLQPPVA
jgi:myo-inositol-1(or 4)-monophosphatase